MAELQEVFSKIEGHKFAAELNLASGSKSFTKGLRDHELFGELVHLAKEPARANEIAKHVLQLSAQSIDPQYENPFDAALSAYLTAIGGFVEPETLTRAAAAAFSAKNCWWASNIASGLLTNALASGDAVPLAESLLDSKNLDQIGCESTIKNPWFTAVMRQHGAKSPDSNFNPNPKPMTSSQVMPILFDQPQTNRSTSRIKHLRINRTTNRKPVSRQFATGVSQSRLAK